MPAAVIVGALAATGATAAIGATVGAAIVGSAVSATTAAVIGSAVVGAGVAAASGGGASDILKGAVLGGVTAGVGSGIANTVSEALVDAGVNSAVASTAGSAVAGGAKAALTGGDIEQAMLLGGLNSGLNQAIDTAATAINTPTPNTDDFTFSLPEYQGGLGDMGPVDYSLNAPSGGLSLPDSTDTLSSDFLAPVDYSLGSASLSDSAPSFGFEIGSELNAPSGNYDMAPVDYSLSAAPLGDNQNARFGTELTMDSIMGRAPGLTSMGGAQGLVTPSGSVLGDPNSFINSPEVLAAAPAGNVSAAGFIDANAMPALGDPTSFINNPAVTGQPVIPTPACAYNVNMPNLNFRSLLGGQTRRNQAMCYALGGLDMGIPWLNTKAQMLNAMPANTGCASTSASGARPAELSNIYSQITPELRDVFAEKGIGQQTPASLGFTPLALADGGTASCSTVWGEMSKFMPKFHGSTGPSMLQTVKTQKQAPSLSQLKQMYSGISQQGNMGGMAKGGLPSKYHEAMPDGHNPEFVTGLTGYYAGGRGTGQSDDIPAMLHDGDYVIDAEAVSALGDGSSKAGKDALTGFMSQVPHRDGAHGKPVPAKIADGEFVLPEAFVTALGGGDNKRGAQMLDAMRERLRSHKRSAPTSKIPPKALSPLDYLKKA